jgi:hypothetical protein
VATKSATIADGQHRRFIASGEGRVRLRYAVDQFGTPWVVNGGMKG